MPILNTDVFLHIIERAQQGRVSERERYSRLGDVPHIHLALGGEDVCREILRDLNQHIGVQQRIAEEREQKHRARVLRDRQRQELTRQDKSSRA